MPYRHESEHIKLVGLQDRRRKLTDEQKSEILRLRTEEGWRLSKLAKEYEVSKKLILLIVNPDAKKKNDQYIKDNWREFQQSKEVRAGAIRSTRRYKQELMLKGELK